MFQQNANSDAVAFIFKRQRSCHYVLRFKRCYAP
jgi:hypothetical protein